MVRRRFYIPREVQEAIKSHIHDAVQKAITGYASAAEDEDTLTGHLGANLQTGKQAVEVEYSELPGTWKWSMDYYKFRGRGPQAAESFLGADGIFELNSDRFSQRETKSLLFQAKIADTDRERLLEQCVKLSTWRESAFVMLYSPDGFAALSIDDVIRHRGNISAIKKRLPLEELLGSQFLQCDIGDFSLKYQANSSTLFWRAMNDEMVSAKFSVKHRVKFDLEPPQGRAELTADRTIDPSEIHKYRLKADDEDILGVGIERSNKILSKAAKQLARVYHPDLFPNFRPDLRELVQARMQEVNIARGRLKEEE